MKKTFDINNEPIKSHIDLSIYIPIPSYLYIRELRVIKMKNENLLSSFKSLFLEGLEILKEKYPLIKGDKSFEKRAYMRGKQKQKVEIHKRTMTLPVVDINWINAYILYKREENIFFTKADFINDLVNELKKKYSEGESLN